MVKSFQNLKCPTKDETITLSVNYVNASSLEDACKRYVKGRLINCSSSHFGECSSCHLHHTLPNEIME